MELTFLGATQTVTGSSYVLTVGNRRVMVDCGLYQGHPDLQERNYTHPDVKWSEIDAILLTHAHIDHCGLIPRAVRFGYAGPIYAHQATIDLAEIMLTDSAEIHERDAKWLTRKRKRAGKPNVEPLFTKKDVTKALQQFVPVKYGRKLNIFPEIKAEFRDAGHILGAASIRVEAVEGNLKRSIVFSGDIGNHGAPILREPRGFDSADVVLIETTYGNRVHESRTERYELLKKIFIDAYADRAKIVIPAFTVGRTQELLYVIGEMMEKAQIPILPVHLDSPMAIKATAVHKQHPECFDKATQRRISKGDNPFYFPSLNLSLSVSDSRKINRRRGAAAIIAGGGMCQGGRIVHHLKHNIYRPENHLIFVGYQARGTLGRVILSGRKMLRLFGEDIAVKAKITAIGAFSAHADKNGLVDWLSNFKTPPQIVFTVHGEVKPAEDFGNTIREELGFQSYLPKLNQVIDLATLETVDVGRRKFVKRSAPGPDDVMEIVDRVSILGEEFKTDVGKYITALEKRIKKYEKDKALPQWQEKEVRDVLTHMSDAVSGDIDSLEDIAARP